MTVTMWRLDRDYRSVLDGATTLSHLRPEAAACAACAGERAEHHIGALV